MKEKYNEKVDDFFQLFHIKIICIVDDSQF